MRLLLFVLLWSVGFTSAAPTSAWTVAPHPSFPFALQAQNIRGPGFCRLVYWRASGRGNALSSPWAECTEAPVTLHRVAAGTEYNVQLQKSATADGRSAAQESTQLVRTAQASLPFNTTGFARVQGAATFSLLMVDVNVASAGFDGFVVFDSVGDIVWAFNFSLPAGEADDGNFPSHGADQLPDGAGFVFQTMIRSTPLMWVSALGELVEAYSYDEGCGIITHEARWDASSASVLSTKEDVRVFPDLEYPQTGNDVIRWNPSSNTYETIYNLFQDFDPASVQGELDNTDGKFANNPYNDTCNGTETTLADWTHLNSVSVGTRNNYILSVRHWSAVLSIDRDTHKLQWTISSEVESINEFEFTSNASKFFDQHAVTQQEDGSLVLFDNGNARPDGRFSRGLVLDLDLESKTATMRTEVRGPYQDHEGSNYRLASGNYLVTFPGGFTERTMVTGPDHQWSLEHADIDFTVAFEYDESGAKVAVVTFPFFDDTPYRGTPLDNVAGESVVSTPKHGPPCAHLPCCC